MVPRTAALKRGWPPRPARRALRPLPILVAAIVAVALRGCEPHATDQRVTGIILFDEARIPDWPPAQILGTATAGVPLELTLWTAGGIGCGHMRRGNTEVTPLGRSALVVPFDVLTTHEGGFLQPVEDPGCFGMLRSFEHTATVVFEEPGTAEIVLV